MATNAVIGTTPVASNFGLQVLAAIGLPIIIAPSGTVAANGAITLGTALPTTYSAAYIYLPAGAAFAGSAAGLYFTIFSSTTVGVVYNNIFNGLSPSGGIPGIPSILVPIVAAGPGAYTGVTGNTAVLTLSAPPNVMGPHGGLRISFVTSYPNNANTKAWGTTYGGSTIISSNGTTTVSASGQCVMLNRGITNQQAVSRPFPGTTGNSPVYISVDSTQPQLLIFLLNLATATDFVIYESLAVELISSTLVYAS